MRKKLARMIVFTLILMNVLTLSLNTKPVVAETQASFKDDKWSFDEDWMREFAYVKDNLTRLILGVTENQPNSYERSSKPTHTPTSATSP